MVLYRLCRLCGNISWRARFGCVCVCVIFFIHMQIVDVLGCLILVVLRHIQKLVEELGYDVHAMLIFYCSNRWIDFIGGLWM